MRFGVQRRLLADLNRKRIGNIRPTVRKGCGSLRLGRQRKHTPQLRIVHALMTKGLPRHTEGGAVGVETAWGGLLALHLKHAYHTLRRAVAAEQTVCCLQSDSGERGEVVAPRKDAHIEEKPLVPV